MRIVYFDDKSSIEEPETRFVTLVDAFTALDKIFKAGIGSFGQILSNEGAVLQNVVPTRSSSAETQDTTAQAV